MASTFIDGWEDRKIRRHLAEICAGCPVLKECVTYCLANDVAGFAAGMTPQQRDRVRGARLAAPAAECGHCGATIDGHGNRTYCDRTCQNKAYHQRKAMKASAA